MKKTEGFIYIEFKPLAGSAGKDVHIAYHKENDTFHESRDGSKWREISDHRAELLCGTFKLHRHVTVTWRVQSSDTILEKSMCAISRRAGWDDRDVPPELWAAMNEPVMKL